MAAAEKQLRASGSVTLNASGNGTVTLGPSSGIRGSAYWHVTGLTAQTQRGGVSAAGLAPIPKFQAYQDAATPDNTLGLTYDGSFTSASADEVIQRGQNLVFVWTGGLAGDVAYVTVTGTQS